MSGWLCIALTASALGQDPDPGRIQELIRNLGNDDIVVRERAVEELAKIGRPALKALDAAAESKDPEVKARAAQAIQKITWGKGIDRLNKYVAETFGKDVRPEQVKDGALAPWAPNTRFYEVVEQPGAGAAAGLAAAFAGAGAAGGQRSFLAIRKEEDALYRVAVKGFVRTRTLGELLCKEEVRLADEDQAFDFAVALSELLDQAGGMQSQVMAFTGLGMGKSFDRTEEGWRLSRGIYGGDLLFKTDAEGKLLGVETKANYNPYGALLGLGGGDDEKANLEVQKLKLEIELLKRQLEKNAPPK
jgi:hypothetical protein